MPFSRREFLGSTAAAGIAGLVRLEAQRTPAERAVFRHGVASGDPLSDSVILWTRVTAPPARGRRSAGRSRRTPTFTRIVAARQTRDWRRARLHRQDRRERARAGDDVLLPLHDARRAIADRPHANAARVAHGARPAGSRVVLELSVRILQRLPAHRASAPTSTPCSTSATTSTSTRTAAMATALRSAAIPDPESRDRRARRLPAPATRSTSPIPICRRPIASTPSSWCGTTTRSRTTPGGTAPRTISPIAARARWAAAARRGRAGVLRVDADPRGSRDAAAEDLPDVRVRRPRGSDHARHAAHRSRRAGRPA